MDTALVGGVVYQSPEDETLRDATVLIRDGKIAAVGPRESVALPQDAARIDCAGLTVTAGFWNSHVHFFERKWSDAANIPAAELGRQLQDMLARFGFTTVFDLSSPWDNTSRIRERIESGEVPGPRILSTGPGLLPRNAGLPPDAVLNFMGLIKDPLPEVQDPAHAASLARGLLDRGVDAIKVFVSSPSKATLSPEEIRAAADEAHKDGKPVFAHPNSSDDIATALEGGVDIIGHTTPRSGPWSEALIGSMLQRHAALTPTLTLWKYFLRHDRVSVQDHVCAIAGGQLGAWLNAGGTVLFGTDLGAVEYDPADEYALMAGAGMSFRQVLASLTTAPAARFGVSGRLGCVAAGLQADLTVVEGDPERDLRALTAVRYTIREGKFIYGAPH